MPLLLP